MTSLSSFIPIPHRKELFIPQRTFLTSQVYKLSWLMTKSNGDYTTPLHKANSGKTTINLHRNSRYHRHPRNNTLHHLNDL
jgi:hypothetical protein